MAADPLSNLSTPLLRLWVGFISIVTFVSFNLALTLLADLRLCLLASALALLVAGASKGFASVKSHVMLRGLLIANRAGPGIIRAWAASK